jgi:uncharacterized protein (DUF433 family)
MELTVVQHITVTPGLRGGKPHIVGRRITVSDIAFFHLKQGMSVPIILTTARRLTAAQPKIVLLPKSK